MNPSIYKEADRSGFQMINAEDWENGKLFKWQERKINQLAEERKIKFSKLRELMKGWGVGDLIGGLNRKQAMVVIKELKNFKQLVNVVGENRAIIQRTVGTVKVREF